MFAFVLLSLTSLLLAGVLVHAVFTSRHLRNRKTVQQTLLGVIFGVMVISLGMSSISFDIIPTQFDAKAGPLVFAGYLGGPIGGLIAGLCGALYRIAYGESFVGIAVFMNLATAAIGVAAYYLRPPRKWPEIQWSTVVYIMAAFVLLHIVPLWYLAGQNDAPDPYETPIRVMVAFTLIGMLSILLTWQILIYVLRFASEVNRSAELDDKLGLAMHASGMGMFEHERGEPVSVFDAGMMSIYGLDRAPGPVPLDEWAAMIHQDDLRRVEADMERAWAGKTLTDKMNFRIWRPDGSLRYIRATWAALIDSDGTAKRITGMHADLTDFREAQLEHASSAQRLALIAEKLPGVIVEFDLTDWDKPLLTYISPKCVEIWGYSADELYADRSLLPRMHDPEDIGSFLRMTKRCCETGESVSHRYKITARDGTRRWLDLHGGSSVENGKTLIKAIVLDVTREVAVEEQIEHEREIARRAQKNESIGQLTGGVAHDFNNLLAVIMGNLELLEDYSDPAIQKELIDAAITATLRGADLTKNMLAFARKAPLKPEVLDLNTVVREAKNWIGRTLPESVAVETSLLAGLWPVEADRSSLASALLNLALNARDAMDGKGNLTIETANVRIDEAYIDSRLEELAPGRYVMLAVSDTGPGIPKEVLASIFEPFFTTKAPGVGSGLGLSMTDGFMRQSGGTVQVYTESGKGTTFKLYFPATNVQAEQATPPSRAGADTGGGGRRILLAEDEEAVRNTLVTILERAGYQVTATASGDAAFAAFEADPTFDMLLTDIVMPGKRQGTDLARELRERWPHLPVLFMSGYASEATVHGNGLRPKDTRLMKPVQRADLLAAVARVIADLRR